MRGWWGLLCVVVTALLARTPLRAMQRFALLARCALFHVGFPPRAPVLPSLLAPCTACSRAMSVAVRAHSSVLLHVTTAPGGFPVSNLSHGTVRSLAVLAHAICLVVLPTASFWPFSRCLVCLMAPTPLTFVRFRPLASLGVLPSGLPFSFACSSLLQCCAVAGPCAVPPPSVVRAARVVGSPCDAVTLVVMSGTAHCCASSLMLTAITIARLASVAGVAALMLLVAPAIRAGGAVLLALTLATASVWRLLVRFLSYLAFCLLRVLTLTFSPLPPLITFRLPRRCFSLFLLW